MDPNPESEEIIMKSPNWEAIKEIARWVVLFIISWVITEILAQIALVPESYALKVWVFTFSIPLQTALATGLTFAGRYVDKFLFVKSQESPTPKFAGEKPKGLLPF